MTRKPHRPPTGEQTRQAGVERPGAPLRAPGGRDAQAGAGAVLRGLAREIGATIAADIGRARAALAGPLRREAAFWLLALVTGALAGIAAVLFRLGINRLQARAYGTDDILALHSFASHLPWYWIVAIPTLGGLAVGLLLHVFTVDGRVHSVAEVIEAAALHEGRVERKAGIVSALASLITLSTGGSSGREGPVVHLAGVISTQISRLVNLSGVERRDLLGCAVAAAVSASFNAPLAGTIFALEVILRHYALHALTPIVIAAVAGTVVSRLFFGDVTEFLLASQPELQFYVELPAFLLLGLVCGVVAVAMMRAIFVAEDVGSALQAATGLPRWTRPTLAGFLLGTIAVAFPHVIGVGYETTSRALTGQLGLQAAIVFAVVKVVAVAITLGGRMGGGVFSPSLMVGALTGLAFGLIATQLFPEKSGSETLYALAGMGAVAAAVLGAPISTTLIVFELTGDWQTGLAVLLAVSMSSALAARLVDRSFFLTVLERRNIHLARGPQAYLLGMSRVARLMRPPGEAGAPSEEACWALISDGIYVDGNAALDAAMPIFEKAGVPFIPVVTIPDEDSPSELWGVLAHVDALKEYNRALAEHAAEASS